MGHVNLDITLRGETGAKALRKILGAKQVTGLQTLESLGLKPNHDTGKLEPTRPKRVAYFYLLY